MQLLHDKGADADSKDGTGRTVLSWAANNTHKGWMESRYCLASLLE
jgi:autotransporter-associated beta strand protein